MGKLILFISILMLVSLACGESTERKAVETAVAEEDEATEPLKPTSTPKPTPPPILGLVRIGTHMIGKDIQPGIYWGLAGEGLFGSCYWARVSDLTGDLGSILANDNATGQYYVEIKANDYAFETGCELILLEHAPLQEVGDVLATGTYIIGRDIQPGTYQGQAGEEFTDSCYWARLTDVSGDLGSIIANDNALGSYYVQVLESDFALITACPLEWVID
jgi:hypothetical protein